MAAVDALNAMAREEVEAVFVACCGSYRWVDRMVDGRPYVSRDDLLRRADAAWAETDQNDWLEAFAHHPRIGERAAAVAQGAIGRQWSAAEQSSVDTSEKTSRELADVNAEYERRFGFIYIVCATGRSAAEMLALARQRLGNDRPTELLVAAEEQRKIMELRLKKLLDSLETR